MAFVPNTAAPAPIILHHTPSDTASPALLYPGEAAVCHGPLHTKLWIGDGTTNRLFLSTNPADSPLLNQTVLGGPFLSLSGGTLAGPGNLTLDGGTLTFPTTVASNPETISISATDGWLDIYNSSNVPITTGIRFKVGNNVLRMIDAVGGWMALVGSDGKGTHFLTGPGGRMTVEGALVGLAYIQSYGELISNSDLWVSGSAVETGGHGFFRQISNHPANVGSGVVNIGRMRGTATAYQPLQLGDIMGRLNFQGYETGFLADTTPYPITGTGATIDAIATENWSEDNYGAAMRFSVTPNGGAAPQTAMTLEQDGALRLSSDRPTVVWDKTGTDPFQWSLRTVDGVDETFWGLHEGGDWRFYIWRRSGPPPIYTLHSNDPLIVDNYLSVSSYVTCNDLSTTHVGTQTVQCAVGSDNPLDAPTIEFQRRRETGNIQTGDVIGNLHFRSREQGGGTWQAAMIQAVATENHAVDIVGTELQFFTAPNGSMGSGTPAMTLEQNANLTVVGTVTASGSLLTSDPDLKDDIARAPSGALAKVCELPVIDYRWKHGRDSKVHRGFSADDVRRVMGADSGCSAEGAYSLADMNAYLWRAVQELSVKVQELEQRVLIH